MLRCSRSMFEYLRAEIPKLRDLKTYINVFEIIEGENDYDSDAYYAWYNFDNIPGDNICPIAIPGDYLEVFLPCSRFYINYIWPQTEKPSFEIVSTSKFSAESVSKNTVMPCVDIKETLTFEGKEYSHSWTILKVEYDLLIPDELKMNC